MQNTAPTKQAAIAAAAAYTVGKMGHIASTGKAAELADTNAANGPRAAFALPTDSGAKLPTFYFSACIGAGGNSTEHLRCKARAGVQAQHAQKGAIAGLLVAPEYGWQKGNCALASGAFWATDGNVYVTDSVTQNPTIGTMPEPIGVADCMGAVLALYAQHVANPQALQNGRAAQRAALALAKQAKQAAQAAPVADGTEQAAPVADPAPVAESTKGTKRTKQKQAA